MPAASQYGVGSVLPAGPDGNLALINPDNRSPDQRDIRAAYSFVVANGTDPRQLMLAGMAPLTKMGFSVAVGIAISAFVMPIFLVPSVTALLGTRAWWPRRLKTRPSAKAAGAPTGVLFCPAPRPQSRPRHAGFLWIAGGDDPTEAYGFDR